METDEGPRDVAVEFATASYLPMLGLEPSRGRWFALVTHRAWRTLFGSDPGVVGRTVRMNGQRRGGLRASAR